MPVLMWRRGEKVNDIGSWEYRHSPVTEREYSWIHQRSSFHSQVSASRKTCLSAFCLIPSQSHDLLNGVKLLDSLSACALWVSLCGVGSRNGCWCTRLWSCKSRIAQFISETDLAKFCVPLMGKSFPLRPHAFWGETDKPLESVLDNARSSQDRAQEIYSVVSFIRGRVC